MACMEEKALVDYDDPASSKVLGWILRSEPDSALITDEVVKKEHDAFLAWIDYHSRCHSELCEPLDDPCANGRPIVDPGVSSATLIAGCDKASLLQAFDKLLRDAALRGAPDYRPCPRAGCGGGGFVDWRCVSSITLARRSRASAVGLLLLAVGVTVGRCSALFC